MYVVRGSWFVVNGENDRRRAGDHSPGTRRGTRRNKQRTTDHQRAGPPRPSRLMGKALEGSYKITLNPPPEQYMADLQTRLTEHMKAALKAGQKERLGVIRMLLSDVKNVDLM